MAPLLDFIAYACRWWQAVGPGERLPQRALERHLQAEEGARVGLLGGKEAGEEALGGGDKRTVGTKTSHKVGAGMAKQLEVTMTRQEADGKPGAESQTVAVQWRARAVCEHEDVILAIRVCLLGLLDEAELMVKGGERGEAHLGEMAKDGTISVRGGLLPYNVIISQQHNAIEQGDGQRHRR